MTADARRRSPVLCQSVTVLPLQLSAFYCFAASISSCTKKNCLQDWKAGLKLPPVDTRYKTEIWWYTGAGTDCGAKHSLHATSPITKQGSSAAAELDVERLKVEQQRSVQTIQQWKTIYENLHQFCVSELLDGNHVESNNG